MDEIKMWAVEQNGTKVVTAKSIEPVAQLEAERQLEELLIANPAILMPNLRLVGRQNPTPGGFLDLLGIDEDGNLVVFELKRGTLSREAIAQSIDYASYLDQMTKETLAQHISDRSGVGGIEKIENFENWYQETYPSNPNGFTKQPRIVLVGLGADEKTERMAAYLSQSNLNISLITFHGFTIDGKTVLAKHVKVKMPEGDSAETSKYSKTVILQALKELAAKCGSTELLEMTSSFIKEAFLKEDLPVYVWPSKSGYSFSLMEQTEQGTPTYRAYVSIYLNEKKPRQLQYVFWKRAVDAAPQVMSEFQSKTGAKTANTGNIEIWIKSTTDWENIKEDMNNILKVVAEEWKAKRQELPEGLS